MQKIRGAALLAATALAASGLVACGGEGEPAESSSTASPSAPEKSSEASGSETSGSSDGGGEGEVAELPAAAKKQTKEGAIAFNEFYWEQAGLSYKTGDPSFLEQHSNGCPVCDNMSKRVRAAKNEGTTANINPYSVRDSSATPRVDSGQRVQLTVDIAEYHMVNKDGTWESTIAPQSFTVVSDTRWVDGKWEMRDQVRTK